MLGTGQPENRNTTVGTHALQKLYENLFCRSYRFVLLFTKKKQILMYCIYHNLT